MDLIINTTSNILSLYYKKYSSIINTPEDININIYICAFIVYGILVILYNICNKNKSISPIKKTTLNLQPLQSLQPPTFYPTDIKIPDNIEHLRNSNKDELELYNTSFSPTTPDKTNIYNMLREKNDILQQKYNKKVSELVTMIEKNDRLVEENLSIKKKLDNIQNNQIQQIEDHKNIILNSTSGTNNSKYITD